MKLPSLLVLAAVAAAHAADPALTIYNQDFAVVRETVPLDLKAGVNAIQFADAAATVEPASVVLRDPAGKVPLQILEQNYRNDPVSEGLLLSLSEGKWIDFLIKEPNKADRTVSGKIIRSGYVSPHAGTGTQPIVEMEGKLVFALPGQPLFPALADDTVLKPALSWKIQSAGPAKVDAELSYLADGLSWHADYNVVSPEKGNRLDLVGWITMDNQSGKTYPEATFKLMAGDVHRAARMIAQDHVLRGMSLAAAAPGGVEEKTFDEYHLYTLPHPTTLHDAESKQVEFLQAMSVPAERFYIYDGANLQGVLNTPGRHLDPGFGTAWNTKVAAWLEFKNSEANHLGLPLPAGHIRFYRHNGAQLEFVGEDTIDHTPKDETLRLRTGNAFDLVGERHRTKFAFNQDQHTADESIAVTMRNHKTEAVNVKVVEHLFRSATWQIKNNTLPFERKDAQTIEFPVPLPPDQEQTVSYDVHYSW